MTELRYDGPDLEADTSGRMQGLVMAAVMAGDGIHAGRASAAHRDDQRRHNDTARAVQQDRATWAGVPSGDWAELASAACSQPAPRNSADASKPLQYVIFIKGKILISSIFITLNLTSIAFIVIIIHNLNLPFLTFYKYYNLFFIKCQKIKRLTKRRYLLTMVATPPPQQP